MKNEEWRTEVEEFSQIYTVRRPLSDTDSLLAHSWSCVCQRWHRDCEHSLNNFNSTFGSFESRLGHHQLDFVVIEHQVIPSHPVPDIVHTSFDSIPRFHSCLARQIQLHIIRVDHKVQLVLDDDVSNWGRIQRKEERAEYCALRKAVFDVKRLTERVFIERNGLFMRVQVRL